MMAPGAARSSEDGAAMVDWIGAHRIDTRKRARSGMITEDPDTRTAIHTLEGLRAKLSGP